jgi:hypothetical protein
MKLGRRKIIQVSLEVTPGTAVPGAVNLLCYDPELNPEANEIQREPSGAYGGQAKAERGPSIGTCKFKSELRSNGTTGLDVGLAACFQACGMKLTALVLAPATLLSDQKTLTIDYYADGRKKQLRGACGTYQLSGEFGKQVFVEFTFTGLFTSLADVALPAVTQTTQAPMLTKAAVLTIGAYVPKISKFSVNPNNKVEPREDITTAEGIAHYFVGPSRRYMVTMDPEVEVAATWDIEALWVAKTEAALSLKLSDGTVDVTIAAPKLQHTAPQEAARDSKSIHNLNGQCNANAGDDELTITTAAHV